MKGQIFYKAEDGKLSLGNALFDFTLKGYDTVDASEDDTIGLSAPYTKIKATGEAGELEAHVWEDLPVVRLVNSPNAPILYLAGEHWTFRAVKLNAFTDDFDALTTETENYLFMRNLIGIKGDIFYIESELSDLAHVIVCEAPDYVVPNLRVKNGEVFVDCENNAIAIGTCKKGECEALARAYYRHVSRQRSLITMSNTWGDYNGVSRVCADFIMKEIDAGEKIGIDVVQIDDGWQKGNTYAAENYDPQEKIRLFEGDFWEISKERFPDGFKPIADYAKEKGIKVGFWFAPASKNGYELIERDKEVLKNAYENWNMRFVKLDMYRVASKFEQEKILELFHHIHSLGDDVSVQIDVTRDLRVNYLCGNQYGKVFVENRYSKTHNSYPHRVLRNLWMLGRHVATSRFQFELINPDLNADAYPENDPYAPVNYTLDYLFASVMFSNPLFWMEMQFLSDKRLSELQRIVPVWKAHRDALVELDIMPIGQKPTGHSITGFAACKDGKAEYLLLFREAGDECEALIPAPVAKGKAELLASNNGVKVKLLSGEVKVTFPEKRSYAFIKIR